MFDFPDKRFSIFTMPREQFGFEEISRRSIAEYPGVFRILHGDLYCVLCNKTVAAQRFWNVKQHLRALRHKEHLKDSEQTKPTDRNSDDEITGFSVTSIKKKCTSCDTSSDSQGITQSKDNTTMLNPTPLLYTEDVVDDQGRYIWCSIDEKPTDDHRFVLNFKFGVLNEKQYTWNFLETHASVDPSLITSDFEKHISRLGDDLLLNLTKMAILNFCPFQVYTKARFSF